jgi:hypothetical protein
MKPETFRTPSGTKHRHRPTNKILDPDN